MWMKIFCKAKNVWIKTMGLEILRTIWGMWYWEHFYSQLGTWGLNLLWFPYSSCLLFVTLLLKWEQKGCCPSRIVLCLVWYLMGFIIIDPPKKTRELFSFEVQFWLMSRRCFFSILKWCRVFEHKIKSLG